MKRAFLILVFAVGTVGGFAHGFRSLGHCSSGGWAAAHAARRAEFEEHVAEVCVRAAERTRPDVAAVAPQTVAPVPSGVTLSGPVTITVGAPALPLAAPAITAGPEIAPAAIATE